MRPPARRHRSKAGPEVSADGLRPATVDASRRPMRIAVWTGVTRDTGPACGPRHPSFRRSGARQGAGRSDREPSRASEGSARYVGLVLLASLRGQAGAASSRPTRTPYTSHRTGVRERQNVARCCWGAHPINFLSRNNDFANESTFAPVKTHFAF
jgi:hypothetical protein